MRVVWTDEATSHLDGSYAFIALTSPVYARRLIDKIVSRADDLGDFPTMGRVLAKYNDPSIRELVVTPYTVVYLVHPDSILVLTVIHGARDQRK